MDPRRTQALERLISNLFDNAMKHTPSKGKVTLGIDKENGHARLVVKDTGAGIPPEEIPKIFDRFFSRQSNPAKSTGLGLGLCRWIAEAHRGTIRVDPQKQGTAFIVLLPLDEQFVIQN